MFVLGLLFFFCFLDFHDNESELVAAATAAEDGVAMGPPPSAPGFRDADTAAAVDAEEEDDEETAVLSRLHSSL